MRFMFSKILGEVPVFPRSRTRLQHRRSTPRAGGPIAQRPAARSVAGAHQLPAAGPVSL